jgi:hypothetical protein
MQEGKKRANALGAEDAVNRGTPDGTQRRASRIGTRWTITVQ